MNKLLSIILIAVISFSCCNRGKENILETERIAELSYFIDFVNKQKDKDICISVEKFNSLFDALKVYQLNDSSIVFINKITTGYIKNNMYIIQFRNDLLLIYSNIHMSNNEIFGKSMLGLMAQANAVYLKKEDTIFIPKYNCKYSSKLDKVNFCECPFSAIRGVLQRYDDKYILYYECDERGCFIEGFKYLKTVRNDVLYPLPKICEEN